MTSPALITDKTRIGLTMGQIWPIVAVVITILIVWGNFAVRISTIEQNYLSTQKEIVSMKKAIEDNRNERVNQINELRIENKAEHATLSVGQDRIIDILMKR